MTTQNTHPIADAGDDRAVRSGVTVTLDASRSYDLEGHELIFTWFQLEGPTVALSNSRSARPEFMSPTTAALLRFSVLVSDGALVSYDEVLIRVVDTGPHTQLPPLTLRESVLPGSGVSDLVRAVDQVIREHLYEISIGVGEYMNPEAAPAHLLPWLAHHYRANLWDPILDEAVQRRLISDAWYYNTYRGSGAVLSRFAETVGFIYRLVFRTLPSGARAGVTVNITPFGEVVTSSEWRSYVRRAFLSLLPLRWAIDDVNIRQTYGFSVSARAALRRRRRHR